MTTNKKAIELFEIGGCSETFIRYLKKKGIEADGINNFLNKAREIYSKLSQKKKDIGMLVGKVQSGKTTVFSAVIARYFDKGYDLCIILTSTENLLNNQTFDRMTEVFRNKRPSNIDIFNTDTFLLRNSPRRIEKVIDDFKNGHKYIVTSLKNKQIEKINEVLINNKLWNNKKILIIDDEADLASTGSNDINDVRFANNAIKNMLDSITNYNYLSVTATPHAQVLINDSDVVKPKHVFTYEPGKGYMGLEEFFKERQIFKFIDSKDWQKEEIDIIPESLKEAILRYFINISFYISKYNKIESTTMLIHTSVIIEDHYKLLRLIIKFKDNILKFLSLDKNSLDYSGIINKIKKVFDDAKFEGLIWDEDYIELIKKIITYTNINIINSESDDNIIENLNNIILGSKKVERGVTFENLLLTYITNFHEGTTAVDTILQRARWFGYREPIKECLSIYIIESLYNQYKDFILPSERELWNRLKDAETNDDFDKFQKYITLDGKSAPTNKVKTIRTGSEKVLFCDSRVERDIEIERNAKSIYHLFHKKPKINFMITSRNYTGIMGMTFDEFCNDIKENKIYETLGIDQYFWEEIKKNGNIYPFFMIFLDDAGNNDFRERTPQGNKYQLFEGSSEESGFPGEHALYKVDGLEDKIIIALHKIRDKNDGLLKYYVSLHLPKENIFSGKYFVK